MSEKTVLIVEDDVKFLHILKSQFEHFGWIPLTATDAVAAMSILDKKAHLIDAMVVDFKLPKISGVEFIKSIGNSYEGIATILISSASNIFELAEKNGIQHCLQKPFPFREILKILEQLKSGKVLSA